MQQLQEPLKLHIFIIRGKHLVHFYKQIVGIFKGIFEGRMSFFDS
jgi:hypothetical protein